MKNTIFYLLISILISIGFAGCQQLEDKAANIPIVKTCEAENITASTATIYGEVESLNAIYCFYYFLISEDSIFPDDNCMKFYLEKYEPGPSSRIRAELDELTPGTTYYYVMCATDGVADVRGDVMSFTTTTENRAARVGDYYYTDGTWSATLNDSKEVIGVVFALCEEKFGAINPSLEESNHGRIAELNDFYGGEQYPWATVMYDVAGIPNFSLLDGIHGDGELPCDGLPTNETLPYGISEWPTETGEQYALTDYNGWSYVDLPEYETAMGMALSEHEWGYWYLPALGELARLGMACAAGLLPDGVQLAADCDYWSSSEHYNIAGAWAYSVGAGNNHNHSVWGCEKSKYFRIRRVACF